MSEVFDRRSQRSSSLVRAPCLTSIEPLREYSSWVEAAASEPFQATVFRSIQTALEVVRSSAAAEPAGCGSRYFSWPLTSHTSWPFAVRSSDWSEGRSFSSPLWMM